MTDGPRIAPLPEEDWTDRQREVMTPLLGNNARNIYTTLVRAPDLAEKMTTFGRTLRGEPLSLRQRETLILRTGWNCGSEYEFAQHRVLATKGGMTDDDLRRIVAGPDADGWDSVERALCRAADELHADSVVSDATWAELSAVFGEQELIQAVLLVGYYHVVSFALNTCRTPLEPGRVGFPTD
ncbi:MAG: carboxymuconolactone decarboxylase family protein [Acidobacteria bacterium]|nr:carboxymuconolactone decarboxylase family protein [Acidobacteriota bacterium]